MRARLAAEKYGANQPALVNFDDPMLRRRRICSRPSQNCPIKAMFVVFNHSAYDITPQQMGDIMDQAGAFEAFGVFISVPLALVIDKGEYENVWWEVYKDRTTKRKMIRMGFIKDDALPYEHDFLTYVQLVTYGTIQSSAGKRYYVQTDSPP